jgi:hypothetical protein
MMNFEQYDSENPQIWTLFVHYASMAKQKGFTKYSANGIFEAIRWQTKEWGNDGFKVNNNFRPDYARKMEKEFPDFANFFEKRVLKAVRIRK